MLRRTARLASTFVDYYRVLGVNRNSSVEEIKAAYRSLAKLNHPDAPTGNADKFKEIVQAYEVLRDLNSRRAYNASSSDRGQRAQNTYARDPRNQYDYRGTHAYYQRNAERVYEEYIKRAKYYEASKAPPKEEATFTSRLTYYHKQQAIKDEYERRQRMEDQKALEALRNSGLFLVVLGALACVNMMREALVSQHPSVSRSKSPYLRM